MGNEIRMGFVGNDFKENKMTKFEIKDNNPINIQVWQFIEPTDNLKHFLKVSIKSREINR